jgi:hypothetical protein
LKVGIVSVDTVYLLTIIALVFNKHMLNGTPDLKLHRQGPESSSSTLFFGYNWSRFNHYLTL